MRAHGRNRDHSRQISRRVSAATGADRLRLDELASSEQFPCGNGGCAVHDAPITLTMFLRAAGADARGKVREHLPSMVALVECQRA